jgi:transposase-like protein
MPMDDESSEEMQQVMELIQMGRTANLPCPWCKKDKLAGKPSAYGTRFTCPSCKKFLEAPAQDF